MLVYAYIDESGDEGIGQGTRWLIGGCAVVDDRWKERVEDILFALSVKVSGERPLHFIDLRDDRKLACYQHIVNAGWLGVVAIADTGALFPKSLNRPRALYYEVLKQIIRRVLWRAADVAKRPEIIIDERHRRFDLDGFKAYLAAIDREEDPQTDWSLLDLDRVRTAKADQEPCISLADGLAHATWKAIEPNDFVGPNRTYYNLCRNRLWNRPLKPDQRHVHGNDGVLDNGVILLPSSDMVRLLRQGLRSLL